MADSSISEMKRVRYLLGLSSLAEREHVESEYFEDEDAFEEMLTAEDDLIDAYARGELTGDERQRFEKRFVSSLRERDRVQFARAFEGALSSTRSIETKCSGTVLDFFKTFQSPSLLRAATIGAVIVFVAVLAWQVNDRRRMTNELSELRAETAALSKRTETLQRSSDTERTRTAEMAAQLVALRAQPEKPRHRERGQTATQRARYLPKITNDRDKFAMTKPEPSDIAINNLDASTDSAVERRKITQLPLNASDGLSLISLQPRIPRVDHIMRNRPDSSGGSTVRGTAKDPNGNVVSGATVTLTDSARNFTKTQSTNKDGAYVFNAIPPGTYSMKVRAPGFKTASVSGLAALVDTPTVRDVQLEIGAVSETVDVTSAAEAAINTSDATLGNAFEPKRITELPLEANNVVGLLSLQPGVSRTGFVNGGRTDQLNLTLDGVDASIRIPSFLSWIKFQLTLKTTVIHEDYRITIRTPDARPVTSVNWSEPLTPNQTIIDTPFVSTGDLPSGDYVLLLMGKEPDGSFVKVAEFSFKVIKD